MTQQCRIENVSTFLHSIEEVKKAEEAKNNKADFIYRGQREDKSLRPRLARLVPRGQRNDIERLMFEEFKRTSVALTDFQPQTDWDFLAVAQHHGLPTRLLDWTYSALAALWFAVDKEPVNVRGKEQDGVVWMLKTKVSDFIQETDRSSPFEREPTGIYRPRVITRRISAQGGIFTAHRMMKKEGFVALEKNKRFRDRLTKFTVEASAFPHIRKHLDGCGVNRSTLFPDLVGLCSHLEWRYTKLPDE
jgi:FRG domain